MTRHDLGKERPPRELLAQLVREYGIDQVFNRRSTAFRKLDLAGRELTESEAIDLMLEEPNLIRRPLVLRGKKAVFGYSPDQYDEVLG